VAGWMAAMPVFPAAPTLGLANVNIVATAGWTAGKWTTFKLLAVFTRRSLLAGTLESTRAVENHVDNIPFCRGKRSNGGISNNLP